MVSDYLYILILIIAMLLAVTLHEAMHAFASYWLGDDTAKLSGRLSLNPIKHIDPFLTIILPIMMAFTGGPIFGGAKPVPINFSKIRWNEWGVALVALAGPLMNLMVAFLSFGIWVLLSQNDNGIIGAIFITIIRVNLGFFVFNLIPIPPLDGSRFLYALAPEFAKRAMEYIERFGIIFIFLILIFAGDQFYQFMSAAINFISYVFAHIFGA